MRDIFPENSILHIIDDLPLLICHYARSSRCRSIKDMASYGYCVAKVAHYYGLKLHIMIDDKNLITFVTLTSASTDGREILHNLFGTVSEYILGDKGYI